MIPNKINEQLTVKSWSRAALHVKCHGITFVVNWSDINKV